MKAVLQRVSRASVEVAGEPIATIGPGLLVLVGMEPGDDQARLDWLADKLLGIRVFPDAHKPMNRSLIDVEGELLLVPQFTLAADTRRGMRPGFSTAAPPEQAEPLFLALFDALRARWPRVLCGRFGADMQVALVNDGPVTLLLER